MANPFANTVKFLNAVSLLASPQGATIKGLMDGLNLSRRSVFRLLDALKELGFPLIDYQPQAKAEKAYRLLESYVLKLPNISMLNPCFTEDEIEYVLSILDLCKRINELGGTHRLSAIREKIMAARPKKEGQ
jgi:predicted DNA-binding transcriptional regulator YafY